MKKSVILFLTIAVIALSSFVSAENKIKIEIPESFPSSGGINFMISLYDSQNNMINDNINVVIEDADQKTQIEKTISANKQTSLSLGDNPSSGLWSITANYQGLEAKEFFSIETNEIANFEIVGDKLYIRNVGNSRYVKTAQILIGDTIGTKEIDLNVGEETNFRLVAPDGSYNIKVIVDGKTVISKENVALTGNVIGVLDEKLVSGETPVTGGLKPGEQDQSFYSTVRNKSFVLVFLMVIIGAAILLALERNSRKGYKS